MTSSSGARGILLISRRVESHMTMRALIMSFLDCVILQLGTRFVAGALWTRGKIACVLKGSCLCVGVCCREEAVSSGGLFYVLNVNLYWRNVTHASPSNGYVI